MTIFLPQDPTLFRQAFDETCDRILQHRQNEVFYELFVRLIAQLREHQLLKAIIEQIESESSKKQKEFCAASLEAHEYNWKKLWQYHRRNDRQRRHLAQIKSIVTSPTTASSSPLHSRILSEMWQFRCDSSFFRFVNGASWLFRKAQSDIRRWKTRVEHFFSEKDKKEVRRKGRVLKSTRRDKHSQLPLKISQFAKEANSPKFGCRAEKITSLFSPLLDQFECKYGIPGNNSDEKRRNMHLKAEINFSFCWERLQFLEQCYTAPSSLVPPKRTMGRWESIRDVAWNAAWERCEKEALQCAQMSLRQKLSSASNASIDAFLSCERQIHRGDYEKYLHSLKNHVHARLFEIQSIPQTIENNPLLVSEGTQRANFVIQLANKYWKTHPHAIHDAVFADYLSKCPHSKLLSRPSWERIIRERQLDPRPSGAKKRGKGKKSYQI